MRTASSLHMKRRLNAAEDSAVSIAVFFIDGTTHSSPSGLMTWFLLTSPGTCSDRVAQPVGVQDRGVDVAAGDGVTDPIELEAAVGVVPGRLRP